MAGTWSNRLLPSAKPGNSTLPRERWSVSFQSRIGRTKWIEPYTDKTLEAMPGRGIRRLAVMCPAFVADNLETLEEIGIEGREIFEEAGGTRYTLSPCLNARPDWVEFLARALQTDPVVGAGPPPTALAVDAAATG